MKLPLYIILIIILVFGISWVVNLTMFLSCDFISPWKEEIIHALGLLPVFAPITVWF